MAGSRIEDERVGFADLAVILGNAAFPAVVI